VSRAIGIKTDNAAFRLEGTTAIGWQTPDLNEARACGDATRAGLGKELIERAATGLAADVALLKE